MTSSCKCLSASNSFYLNTSQPVSAKLKHSTGTVKHSIEIFHDQYMNKSRPSNNIINAFFYTESNSIHFTTKPKPWRFERINSSQDHGFQENLLPAIKTVHIPTKWAKMFFLEWLSMSMVSISEKYHKIIQKFWGFQKSPLNYLIVKYNKRNA